MKKPIPILKYVCFVLRMYVFRRRSVFEIVNNLKL